MGVHGLWRLIEPSGKPVPVESLENKILAVDVSIWLHQAIKGFHDAKGAPALNAHLLGIFHRVCKLLYFKIKPVFVFDGGVPVLKRETIAKRNKLKHKNISEADKIQKQLLDTLIKHSAVNKVLGEKAKTELATATSKQEKAGDDLFKLPKKEVKAEDSDDEDSSESDFGSPTKHWNLHNIDTRSEHFKSLPADVRHEILTELKETRKQSSWGRLHELPTQSDDFSGFQMKRLLKRQEVQMALEEAEKEMGGHSLSLIELEEILKDQGVISKNDIGNRIASDENTRYLYIRDIKQALEKARREEEKKKLKEIKEEDEVIKEEDEKIAVNESHDNKMETKLNKADLELEEDLQIAIALSLQEQPSGSGQTKKKKLSDFSFLEDFDDNFETDSEEEKSQFDVKNSKLISAQNYMMEYSGLTPNEIAKIIANNERSNPQKRKLRNLEEDRHEMQSAQKKQKNDEEPNIEKIKVSEQKVTSEKKSEDSNDKMEKSEDTRFVINKDNMILNDSNEGCTARNIDVINIQEKSRTDFHEREYTEKVSMNQIAINDDKALKDNSTERLKSESEESEQDDFEDVEEIDENKEQLMEIKFETEKFNEEDDLFADIFAEKDGEIKPIEEEMKQKASTSTTIIEIEKNPDTEQIELNNHEEQKSELLQDLLNKAEIIKSKENDGKQKNNSEKPLSEQGKKLSEKDLELLRQDLDKEELELRNEQGLRERLGTNITDQMYQEAQELLELFGLPYVVAPMEAEAQCAFLESASLTDGTITDDSDIWLFGGKTVYKNFFNQSKHVLEYQAEDIKHHFKLTREQMILLALLVGSDYTTGLQGVGPVTAMEILANFPPSSTSSFTLSHNQLLMGLQEFKSWFTSGKSIARSKNSLRNKLKNVTFTEGFPSLQVVQAYLNPTVDQSEEKFSWSKPDIVGLIDFGRSKFGWSKIKTEDILKPVLKRMKESKYQSTLLNYFKIKHDLNAEEAQKLMSERVRSAVQRIGQDPKDTDNSDESDQGVQKEEKKKHKKSRVIEGDRAQSVKKKVKKTKNIDELLSDEEFIEIDQIEALLESVGKEKIKKRSKKKVEKHYKLLEKDNFSKLNENNVEEKPKIISSESAGIIESSKEKNSVSLLENKEMNLLIKVLSHQEPSTSENASKIAKVKKVAEKIEKVINPVHEEQELKSKQRKGIKKSNIKKEEIQEKQTPIMKESNLIKLERIAKKLEGKIVMEPKEKKQIRRRRKNEPSTSKAEGNLDEEIKLLQETQVYSEKRVEDIKLEAEKIIQQELNEKKHVQRKLHRKEIIPQKERAQKNIMSTRLKAIEVFRKSKIDPSSKKAGVHKTRPPKEDAELSESSSDSDL